MRLEKLFDKKEGILIGMIHLPPLLSLSGFPGMDVQIEKALADLSALERSGFDGVLIENDCDKPHTEFAGPAQIANLTLIVHEVRKQAVIPVGVQMMLNDWKSSFAIAAATGAQFSRLDVFVDHVTCAWCEICPNPKEIMQYKNALCPDLVLLTDIQVKYKTMVKPRPITTSASLAIEYGSDALVVTGNATGEETPLEKIKEVKKSFPDFPVLVGAGITVVNCCEQLEVAQGAIVGSSIQTRGWIDIDKASALSVKVG